MSGGYRPTVSWAQQMKGRTHPSPFTALRHTCQVLGKSKSETARAPLMFAYNLVVERAEKSGAQALRVRFFFSL